MTGRTEGDPMSSSTQGTEARRFTIEEIREVLSLRDVAVDFARRRWDALGRDEDFDDIGFVRYNEGVKQAAADLALVADVLAQPEHCSDEGGSR